MHWLPVEAPALLDDDAAAKRMETGKLRIKQGDGPKFVARDLLLAGVPPWMVRRALLGAAASAVSSDKTTGSWNGLGGLTRWLFGRSLLMYDANRGHTDATETLGGADEVDAWEQHFASR